MKIFNKFAKMRYEYGPWMISLQIKLNLISKKKKNHKIAYCFAVNVVYMYTNIIVVQCLNRQNIGPNICLISLGLTLQFIFSEVKWEITSNQI